jgi:hypothetical protein
MATLFLLEQLTPLKREVFVPQDVTCQVISRWVCLAALRMAPCSSSHSRYATDGQFGQHSGEEAAAGALIEQVL